MQHFIEITYPTPFPFVRPMPTQMVRLDSLSDIELTHKPGDVAGGDEGGDWYERKPALIWTLKVKGLEVYVGPDQPGVKLFKSIETEATSAQAAAGVAP